MEIKEFKYFFPILAIDVHVGDRVKIQGVKFRVEQRTLNGEYVALRSPNGREFNEPIFQPILHYTEWSDNEFLEELMKL